MGWSIFFGFLNYCELGFVTLLTRLVAVQNRDDVNDPRFVAGHLWWTDNSDGVTGPGGRQTRMMTATKVPVSGPGHQTIGGGSVLHPGRVPRSSAMIVGCGPDGCQNKGSGGKCKCKGTCKSCWTSAGVLLKRLSRWRIEFIHRTKPVVSDVGWWQFCRAATCPHSPDVTSAVLPPHAPLRLQSDRGRIGSYCLLANRLINFSLNCEIKINLWTSLTVNTTSHARHSFTVLYSISLRVYVAYRVVQK